MGPEFEPAVRAGDGAGAGGGGADGGGWDPHRYRFLSVWDLPAPPGRVYHELRDPRGWPRWWPEVREVRQVDDRTGVLTFRSALPYELVVVATAVREDPGRGVLEARMRGDLEGAARWTVTTRGDGAAVAVFQQEVVVRKPLMRALALPGRPFFRANHWLMMRHGRAGLRDLLNGSGAANGRISPLAG
jgi:hypothetical protein